jgi:hypothetical protein
VTPLFLDTSRAGATIIIALTGELEVTRIRERLPSVDAPEALP